MVFDRVDVDEMSCFNKRTIVTFDCETSERQKTFCRDILVGSCDPIWRRCKGSQFGFHGSFLSEC